MCLSFPFFPNFQNFLIEASRGESCLFCRRGLVTCHHRHFTPRLDTTTTKGSVASRVHPRHEIAPKLLRLPGLCLPQKGPTRLLSERAVPPPIINCRTMAKQREKRNMANREIFLAKGSEEKQIIDFLDTNQGSPPRFSRISSWSGRKCWMDLTRDLDS